jgi:hypothetical protein
VANLTFLVEVILSIAAIAVPIVLILWLLMRRDFTVADLVTPPSYTNRSNTSQLEVPPCADCIHAHLL